MLFVSRGHATLRNVWAAALSMSQRTMCSKEKGVTRPLETCGWRHSGRSLVLELSVGKECELRGSVCVSVMSARHTECIKEQRCSRRLCSATAKRNGEV